MQINKVGGILDIFRVASFRNLWIAQIISQVSINMLTFVLGVLIYEQTRSNAAVSLLYLTVGLPAAFFGVISGVYVDRFDRKRVLFISTFLRVLVVLLLYNVLSNILLVYLLTTIITIIGQFFIPGAAALIPHYVNSKLLITANSLFTLTFYSAIIGGFVLGGPFLEIFGSDKIIIFIALLLGVATMFIGFLPQDSVTKIKSKGNEFTQLIGDIKACFSFIQKNPKIGQAILLMTLAQAVIAIFATLGPGFADKILSVKLTDASVLILGPAAIGMVVGAFFIGFFGTKFRKNSLIRNGIYLSGFLLLIIAFISNVSQIPSIEYFLKKYFLDTYKSYILILSIISFFFLGFANSLIDIACNTVLQEQSIDEMRGKVYGFLVSFVGGAAILPVVVSGVLADVLGIGNIIIFLGILLLCVGFVIQYKTSKA